MLRLFRGLFLRVQTELLISIAIRPQGWNMAEGGPHHHIYIYIYQSFLYTVHSCFHSHHTLMDEYCSLFHTHHILYL